MYNESGFSVKSFILKVILVILFVFLLIWLFPMPNLKPVYDRIFAENIETMKDAAKSYYTVDRLPKEVNQTVKMTLSEMLAMKLLLPIADSNDELCDGKASYVEIMKTDKEYVVKTSLTCSNKSDYTIEHMGCYDLCGDKCKVAETPVVTPEKTTPTPPVIKPVAKVTMYQLSRIWYKGYTNNTTAATTQYKHVKYGTETIFAGYSYSCPSGYTPSGSGSSMTCSKSTTTYSYSCPSGYTPSGSGSGMTCSKSTTTYSYSCPSGYTPSGSGSSMTCSKSVVSGTKEEYYGTGSGKSIPTSTSTTKYYSTGSTSVKDCNSCASYIVYTYKIYKVVPTYSTVTATRIATPVTTSQNAAPISTPSTTTETAAKITTPQTQSTYVASISTAQYTYRTYIVDSKWTYNSYEAGYTMVEKQTIPGNTTKVYTPDWVLTLPTGYTKTETKAEYKWSNVNSESGWTYTGVTKQVTK